VSIFRRNKDADRAHEPAEPEVADDLEAGAEDDGRTDDAPAEDVRAEGPWDHGEVDGPDGRVDLGALWVRPVAGMELRLEVDQQSQQVNAATVVLEESALQVQAFAAPRSGGLWEDIRGEIAAAVEQQGGTVEEHRGALGTELRTRMPSEAGGRTVFAPATFVGVDGPRWFLRGVLSGRAAIDEAAAAPLVELFRQVVVVRGGDPMAPRELLPLRLPADADVDGGTGPADAAAEGEERPDIDPFERGPEITEVR
jgi:hypothetical protein